MASGRAPRHDFAPAWLNFPEQRSTGLKISEREAAGHRNHHADYHYGMPRHRSLDQFFDDRTYSSFGSYYAYNNPYRYPRYSQMNGHYYSSPSYRSGGGGGRPLRGAKEPASKHPTSNGTSNAISLEEDFPSLSGESEKASVSGNKSSAATVWDANTRVRILQNSQEHNGKVDSADGKTAKPSQMYKATLPLKAKKMAPRINIDNSTASSVSPPHSAPDSPQSFEAMNETGLTNGHCSPTPALVPEGLEWVGPKELDLLQALAWDQNAYEWHPTPDELLLPDKIKASKDKENQHSNSASVVLEETWSPSLEVTPSSA